MTGPGGSVVDLAVPLGPGGSVVVLAVLHPHLPACLVLQPGQEHGVSVGHARTLLQTLERGSFLGLYLYEYSNSNRTRI